MPVAIHIDVNARKAIQTFRVYEKSIPRAIKIGTKKWTQKLANDLSRSSPKWKGLMQRRLKTVVKVKDGYVIKAPYYLPFVEQGIHPRHLPLTKKLSMWSRSKGRHPLAMAIHIFRHGTHPRPFTQKVINRHIRRVKPTVQKEVNRALKRK